MTVLVEEAPPPFRSAPAPAHVHDLPAARGPLSQSVIDFVTGGRGDVVDASSGVAGQPHDDDFQTALWLLNVLQVATFRDVDPDRPASLRMRTLHWYLEQSFEDQLRRLVPQRSPVDLLDHLRSLRDRPAAGQGATAAGLRRRLVASTPYRGWEADAHTLALARIEGPLKASVAQLQSARYGLGDATTDHASPDELGLELADAVSAAPACSLALANAAWLFGRDRRMRGAALGQLCLLRFDSCIVTDELIPTLERAAPWLVDDAAWGAEVTSVLEDCVAEECAGPAR